MKLVFRIIAEIVLLIHLAVVFVILFGWAFPSLYPLYIGILAATLVSQIALGHCFLSRFEFFFRKKTDPAINYDSSFLSYYSSKLTGITVAPRLLYPASVAFLTISLALALLFH